VNAKIVPDFVPPDPKNWPPPPPHSTDVDTVTIHVHTGDDDLRSSSAAQVTIGFNGGRNPETFNLNLPNQGFSAGSDATRTFALSSAVAYEDVESITLHIVQGAYGGGTDDNWDVDTLDVQFSGPNFNPPPPPTPIEKFQANPPAPQNNKHIVRLVAKDVHPELNEYVFRTFPITHQ
jgi:hypothetical protein